MWHFRSCSRFMLHCTSHCVSALLWLISPLFSHPLPFFLSLSLFSLSLPLLLFLSQRKLYQTLMPVWALTCSSYARVLEQQRGWEKIEAQKEAACSRVMRMRHREIEFKIVFATLGVHYVVELMWGTGMGQDTDPKLLSAIVTLMSTMFSRLMSTRLMCPQSHLWVDGIKHYLSISIPGNLCSRFGSRCPACQVMRCMSFETDHWPSLHYRIWRWHWKIIGEVFYCQEKNIKTTSYLFLSVFQMWKSMSVPPN